MLHLLCVLAPQTEASTAKGMGYDGLQDLLGGVATELELMESVAMGVELMELKKGHSAKADTMSLYGVLPHEIK